MVNDKRTHYRKALLNEESIIIKLSNNQDISFRYVDVSKSGIGITSIEKFDLGENLKLTLNQKENVILRVVWGQKTYSSGNTATYRYGLFCESEDVDLRNFFHTDETN
jgi:hypothetical protein